MDVNNNIFIFISSWVINFPSPSISLIPLNARSDAAQAPSQGHHYAIGAMSKVIKFSLVNNGLVSDVDM